MKVLFVSAVMPYPLYSGGQIRIYQMLKEMSKYHEVSLFAFIRTPEEEKYVKDLRFCKEVKTVLRGRAWQPRYVIRSVLGVYPFVFATYDSGEMRHLIRQELARSRYNLVHIEPGYVLPSVPAVDVPMVVAEHNIEHVVYEGYVRRFPVAVIRPFLYVDVLKLRFWERRVWKQADGVVAVSREDAKEISRITGTDRVSMVPNAVAVSSFPFLPQKTCSVQAPVFLFVGNFSWVQNRDAVEFLHDQVWPAIRKRYPNGTLHIVGKNMPDRLKRRLAGDGLVVKEDVADIRTELTKADIFIAPIHIGGGTKFKILEAMAAGVPVMTTKKGVEGLKIEPGKELLVVTNWDTIGQTVERLLTDNAYRLGLVRAARARIERDYSWENVARRLDAAWHCAYERGH